MLRRCRRPEVRPPQFVVRGKGFTDADPIGTAALDPRRRQMRAAVRRAVGLILRAEDELVEACAVIANGYLRLGTIGSASLRSDRRPCRAAGRSPKPGADRVSESSCGIRFYPLGTDARLFYELGTDARLSTRL